jgi:hypothetical protein
MKAHDNDRIAVAERAVIEAAVKERQLEAIMHKYDHDTKGLSWLKAWDKWHEAYHEYKRAVARLLREGGKK